MGYPTANLQTNHVLTVEPGVYAGQATLLGVTYMAACSVGRNVTFDNATQDTIEVHLVDVTLPDFYTERMVISLTHKLRPMLKFATVTDLVAAMESDLQATRQLYFQ